MIESNNLKKVSQKNVLDILSVYVLVFLSLKLVLDLFKNTLAFSKDQFLFSSLDNENTIILTTI